MLKNLAYVWKNGEYSDRVTIIIMLSSIFALFTVIILDLCRLLINVGG